MYLFLLLLAIACQCAIPASAQVSFEPLYGPVTFQNVVYGSALNYNNREVSLTMDIYMPAVGRQDRYPLIVMVHGGGFIAGNREEMSRWVDYFVNRGYVVANVSYRLGYINTTKHHHCNFIPNYPCLFAADTAEWYRAWYRAVQDVKGAIRYLVNRSDMYRIDPDRVFLFGESAGGFTVLGATFMDVPEERPVFAGELNSLPTPLQPNLDICLHRIGEVFPYDSIARPDLGSIEGDIEWPSKPYTIRGVAHLYGGMFTDLLEHTPPGKHTPVVYQFHRACDLFVPFDSGHVYWGLSWCLSSCWGCYGIDNVPIVHGSNAIRSWNQSRGYGLSFKNDFTTVSFSNDCLLPWMPHNCLDQLNNPCHAPIGFNINRVEEFFRQQFFTEEAQERTGDSQQEVIALAAGPNPFSEVLYLQNSASRAVQYWVVNAHGALMAEGRVAAGEQYPLPTNDWASGIYFLRMQEMEGGQGHTSRLIKKP